MAADKMKNIKLKGGTYNVRISYPEEVQHLFGGKKEKWVTLGTGNPHDAARMAPPIIAKIKREIADARAGRSPGETSVDDARKALAAHTVRPAPGVMMSVEQARYAALLEGAKASPDGWRAIPDFDQTVARLISANRQVDPSEPVVAEMRQEVAAHLLANELAYPPSKAARAALGEAQWAREGSAPKPLPAPSLRLRKLYNEWKRSLSVADKEIGRLDHQFRRLEEVVGDKPANHLSRSEVREFMALVARFPGRKRSADLNALPMRELIERFEADNAAIVARNSARKPEEALEEVPGTLAAATVSEWFSGYRRMFEFAVEERYLDSSPFEGRLLQRTVLKGAPSQRKRQFTEAEIKKIFGAPLFNGFDGDGERGYRSTPGDKIVRDAKYWLPILALFHGGRLTEFAAMPLADVDQDPNGNWFFDLLDRDVKNESSQRIIPVHPKVVALGFIAYVETLRRGNSTWLFPDLDHETKHGPGHAFSKWWGHWMDKHGLTDRAITHHSWRHTWKRRARETADLKKEMHDLLTGHAGTVSDKYGRGADIGPLARDMAKIVFPEFPAIPVPLVEKARE
jgi:integrase